MNSNGTTYQNGRFVNVDEVHNNTKNMTLSGFNQEGGTVTGNIENLTIESKQNTSTTKGSTKGGSLSVSANGLPSGSVNYSKTNGERRVVDNASTFIIGDGSDLKVAKVENTASAIGTTENGKLSIDEYVGYNLENVDKLKTAGGSIGVSTSGITSIGVNYSDKKQEGITKNTVIGNVEIGKSSGDEINRDLDTMTEITEDRDFKTNINVESQTIKYALNPSQFKEDLQIAIIEGRATGRTVVKTIDNVINGDKSQDIGDAERRSLIEIKEAIVRVQTAPAMDIIAEKDLADKNIQARLGVEIEKFDPNDPTLSEKVRERIDELKAEGKELVAFYDKVTKKIFINQNAKDEEVRASIAREYKIKEDLELGRGKENDKGQLRSTVAGEIAYDEIKDRLKKGDKNPISASSFDVAKMDKDSEVTADNYRPEDMKFRKKYRNTVYFTEKRRAKIADGFGDTFTGGITIVAGTVVDGLTYYYTGGIGYFLIKGTTTSAYVVGGNRALTGLAKIGNGIFGSEVREDTLNPIRDMISPKYQDYYDGYESATMFVVGEAATFANKLNTNNLNKGSQINTSFREQKTPISSTKSLAGGKNYNAIKEISQGKVFINDGTPGGTTIAYQKRITYPDGSMSISQKNLTTGEVSFQGINSSGQRISEASLTPHEANTLIGANSSSKMLVGNGAVSQSVISKVSYQTGNNSLVLYDKTPVPVTTNGTLVPPLTTNRALATVPLLTDGVNKVASKLPYNPVLKSSVKYPNLTDSENKFLNDYMNKEMPGKIVSKYNDVNKYEYNATTNPGPLSIGGDDPPIKNFYGGMYNDASNESGIFVRMGDKIKPYGSWYTKVSKNSEVEARVDLAIKKWWVKPNGEIKIRGFETEKSILDTMYYIKFPEGIPKYKGPVGYQGGPFLGGLDQEQYFIPDSWEYGEIIETYPVK